MAVCERCSQEFDEELSLRGHMGSHPWTGAEIQLLKDFYPAQGSACFSMLKRSRKAVYNRANALNLKRVAGHSAGELPENIQQNLRRRECKACGVSFGLEHHSALYCKDCGPKHRTLMSRKARGLLPKKPCGCGCGELIPVVNSHGESACFKAGHNSRAGGSRPPVRRGADNNKFNHDVDSELCKQLYLEGFSSLYIARSFGVSPTCIQYRLRKLDVRMRHPGYTGKLLVCNDGHLVRSNFERLVDDWLFSADIEHVYEPSLPFSKSKKNSQRADFLTSAFFGTYIEVWGVSRSKRYAQKQERKRKAYRSYGLRLFELEDIDFHHDIWREKLQNYFGAVANG